MRAFNAGFALGVGWVVYLAWHAGRALLGRRVAPAAERLLRETPA